MTPLAPIAIFAYNRPIHLKRALDALRNNPEANASELFVFSDAAKNPSDTEVVNQVRQCVRHITGFAAVHVIERQKNYGLAKSIITGVEELCERFGRVIVLEDDLVVAPGFLEFMNRALDRYAENERVVQVSGFIFEVPELRGNPSALFLPFTASWGWATWKRAWDKFDPTAQGWETLRIDADMRYGFNLSGSYDYATMLEKQMKGLRDSWAVRWYWTVFKARGLGLFPPVSLVSNSGFDGSGTHGRGLLRKFATTNASLPSIRFNLPESVFVDETQYRQVCKTLWKQNGGWSGNLVDRIRRMLT